jgi:hypothetical protein
MVQVFSSRTCGVYLSNQSLGVTLSTSYKHQNIHLNTIPRTGLQECFTHLKFACMQVYFRNQRPAIMTLRQCTEYTVLDVELTGLSSGKMQQVEAVYANDSIWITIPCALVANNVELGYLPPSFHFCSALARCL